MNKQIAKCLYLYHTFRMYWNQYSCVPNLYSSYLPTLKNFEIKICKKTNFGCKKSLGAHS